MVKSFECRFCGSLAFVEPEIAKFKPARRGRRNISQAELSFVVCPNPACKLETITAKCYSPYENITHSLEPIGSTRFLPEEVPKAIAVDFAEADSIASLSPKAAATMARRALQGMIRDFWGIEERTLYAEIDALKENLDADLWGAVDSVRKIGNVGAHMKAPTNQIVEELAPNEVAMLLDLLELLAKEWYVARANRAKLLHNVSQLAADVDSRQSPNAEPPQE